MNIQELADELSKSKLGIKVKTLHVDSLIRQFKVERRLRRDGGDLSLDAIKICKPKIKSKMEIWFIKTDKGDTDAREKKTN